MEPDAVLLVFWTLSYKPYTQINSYMHIHSFKYNYMLTSLCNQTCWKIYMHVLTYSQIY